MFFALVLRNRCFVRVRIACRGRTTAAKETTLVLAEEFSYVFFGSKLNQGLYS